VHPFIDAHWRHKDVPLIFNDDKSLKMEQKKNHTFSFAFRQIARKAISGWIIISLPYLSVKVVL